MKPVAIFRHTRTEGPGYFATFLDQHSIPWQVIKVDEGEPIPDTATPFAGICLMGGTVSVNDPLPWIERSCALIREAVTTNTPVIGHCLGGQLMSKALGGTVEKNPVKEIGWGTLVAEQNGETRHWLNSDTEISKPLTVFHWHGETFSLPPGATRLLTGQFCANQMFALGPHLGMQCHVEMNETMIVDWLRGWSNEAGGLPSLPPSIQTPDEIRQQLAERLPAMRRLADRLYSAWIRALRD